MAVCPVCNAKFDSGDYYTMATHFINLAEDSDAYHVQWININISRKKMDITQFTSAIENFYNIAHGGIKEWIINIFVDQFRGRKSTPIHIKNAELQQTGYDGVCYRTLFLSKTMG